MNIKILLFGVTRDIVGSSTLEMDLPEEQSVGDMMLSIRTQYPAINDLNSLLVAVNSEYVDESQVLNQNDEIALIPPVSGG